MIHEGTLAGVRRLREPDNMTVHLTSGDIFVCEDANNLERVLLTEHQGHQIAGSFLQFVGPDGFEVAGDALSPMARCA